MTVREGQDAVLVQHCFISSPRRTPVRAFKISEVKPYAQYEKSVSISFVVPRKRKWYVTRVCQDDLSFQTIERDGVVIYDSRHDVPCNMEKFEQAAAELAECRAAVEIGLRAKPTR